MVFSCKVISINFHYTFENGIFKMVGERTIYVKRINKLKLATVFSKLKRYNLDEEQLDKVLSDWRFQLLYIKEISSFITYLEKFFKSSSYYSLDYSRDTISYHLNNILKSYKLSKDFKYISNVKENHLENSNTPNMGIINDNNYEKLYAIFGDSIFRKDNICEIIYSGYSNRLVELLEKNPKINVKNIRVNSLKDPIYNIIIQNPIIGDTTIIDLFSERLDILEMLVVNNYLDGLKYTYENITEGKHAIEIMVKDFITDSDMVCIRQFDMDFIKNIGDDTLAILYQKKFFSKKDEYNTKLFKMVDVNNYELIKDIISYNIEYFKNVNDNEIAKDSLSVFKFERKEFFLFKYCGITKEEFNFIHLFLNSINQIEYPKEFTEKYASVLGLLNKVFNGNDDELLVLGQTMDSNKKEYYKKLIYECEEDGDILIQQHFSKELDQKQKKLIGKHVPKTKETASGYQIDYYELTGEPFTMLIHCIVDNNLSNNNNLGKEIVKDPSLWSKQNNGNEHISMSLISDKYVANYGNPMVIYGFSDVPFQSIKYMQPGDAGIDRKYKKKKGVYKRIGKEYQKHTNAVTTPNDLINNSRGDYNEVVVSRINDETNDPLLPNYIVCFDRVNEDSKRAAEYFKIPIIIINTKFYRKSLSITEEDLDSKPGLRR